MRKEPNTIRKHEGKGAPLSQDPLLKI